MLPVPLELERDVRFEAALELCEEIFVTTIELARHWRTTRQNLSLMRAKDSGPSWVRLDNGKILYPLSAVLKYQRGAGRFPLRKSKRGR